MSWAWSLVISYLFIDALFIFDAFFIVWLLSRTKTKKPKEGNYKQTNKRKKDIYALWVDLALDSKNIGLILRLKIKASWVPVE